MCAGVCVCVLSGALAVSVRLLHERTNKKKEQDVLSRSVSEKDAVSGCKVRRERAERTQRERGNENAKHKLLVHCLLLSVVLAPDCSRRDSGEGTR